MASIPISIKGVLIAEGHVALAKNDRQEWELPGGRLEPGETPETCLVREIREELGIEAKIGSVVDVAPFEVVPGRTVILATYVCAVESREPLEASHEHGAVAWVPLTQIGGLTLPEVYRVAIARAIEALSP